MKAAIIGGTFNPPHIGHLQLACEVFALGGFDKVVFVPTHIPAHKKNDQLVSPEDRLQMLRLCAVRDFMDIDDCELRRGGISYTVETLDHYFSLYGEKPAFVLGDDLVEGFDRWKKPASIAEKADLLLAHRLYREKIDFKYPHRYLDNPVLDISSSDIRHRIAAGKPVAYLVDPAVEEYIRSRGLYS